MIGRVERLTWRGHGVVSVDGVRHYMPGVIAGEMVEFEPRPEDRLARLVRVIGPAPDRADPGCAQAAGCPGCPLRHFEPSAQRAVKRAQHAATLNRIAGLTQAVPLVGHAPQDGYRARARATPRQQNGAIVLGLAPLPGHPPVDLAECPAQTAGTRALLRVALDVVSAADAPWGLDREAEGVLGVEVDGQPGDGRLSLLVSDDRWDAALTAAAQTHRGVALTRRALGPRGPGPIVHLAGPRHTSWRCEDDRFTATHPAWRPHSPASLPHLRSAVLDLLAPEATDRVLEIGCGVGTLSLPLARHAAHVWGIDIARQAVEDAARNAAAAGLDNTTFQVGDGAHAVRRLLKRGRRFDRVLVHMMRRPLGGDALRQLALFGAHTVLYLAPSVASLARDLAERGAAWTVDTVVALDQLPGTVHLLTIARLCRASDRPT